MSSATRTGTAREARTESTTSRWATSSTISVIAAGGRRRGDQAPQRRAVDRRVGDDDVVADPGLVQPQRLGDGEGQHAGEPVAGERPLDQRRHAQRLRRHPERLAGGPPHEVVGVGVERVEVDDGDRGGRRLRQRVDRGVEPGPQAVAVDEVVAHSMPRLRSSASMSARSSSTGGAARRAGASGRRGREGLALLRRGRGAGSLGTTELPVADEPADEEEQHGEAGQRDAAPGPYVEDEAGRPVGHRPGDVDDHLQGPGQPRGRGQQREPQRAQAVGGAAPAERDPGPDATGDGQRDGQCGPRSPIHTPRVPQRTTAGGQ